MKKFIKENWFKIFISLCVFAILFSVFYYLMIFIPKKQDKTTINNKSLPNCMFDIKKGKEWTGSYGKGQDSYVIYNGVIKNESPRRELFKAMIVKTYDENNVLMTKGYREINDWIDPDKGLNFNIHTYAGGNSPNRIDIYPWFLTCK